MLNFLAPLALSLAQAAAVAQPLPDLTLEQSSALRCSVAFGLVHQGQKAGNADFSNYPAMAERGQEFFVRTTARLMDDLGADRDTIMALVVRETQSLSDTPGRLDEVMPACLLLLDASGL
jgi:hypothetical protein